MPLNARSTWIANQLVGASDLNAQIRDNINYLLNERPIPTIQRTGVADYTTTSNVFVTFDTTNFRLTATVNSGRFMVIARGRWQNATAANFNNADFLLDGTTRLGGANGIDSAISGSTGGVSLPFVIFGVYTGLSVGSHTFDVVVRSPGATTLTVVNNGVPLSFYGMEV